MTIFSDLIDTNRVLRLFRDEGRTTLRDVLPALEDLDLSLQLNARKDAGPQEPEWRSLSVDSHLLHAQKHLRAACEEFHDHKEFLRHLRSTAVRVLFAMTLHWARQRELAKIQPIEESLNLSRAN